MLVIGIEICIKKIKIALDIAIRIYFSLRTALFTLCCTAA